MGKSTTVEIILYYLTLYATQETTNIYNSRNYSILLNYKKCTHRDKSTTVEIILYYLTQTGPRNRQESTTVEIILYYLTSLQLFLLMQSTTVEIILYYLTFGTKRRKRQSTTVEIILYYLTLLEWSIHVLIYNSRNYSILLNDSEIRKTNKIYNSRNYSILLNKLFFSISAESTTVEIILYYLTATAVIPAFHIYNSRNYSILLN